MATPRVRLVDGIRVPFGYEHYVRLRAIDAHDFGPVVRKVAQDRGGLEAGFADTAIAYLKRYYALLVLDPLNPATMARPIDDFWHIHALHSHEYFAFCNEVFGEYLHHVPLLFDDELAMSFVAGMYERTRARQIEVFGDIDDAIFPERLERGLCCTPTILTSPALIEQALFPALDRSLLTRGTALSSVTNR